MECAGWALSRNLFLKGVQVVLVWKYSESEEEPRPLNITLRTARAYAASDRSWRPVRSSSSHIEPPLIYDNREHYWGPPAPLGALGVSGLRGSASWFGGSSRRLHRRTEHTLSSVTVITSSSHPHPSLGIVRESHPPTIPFLFKQASNYYYDSRELVPERT